MISFANDKQFRVNNGCCAGGFIVRDHKFLFGKRSASRLWYAGVWDIFGGHSFPGEDPADTLKRELDEELGIIPTQFELVATADLRPGGHFELVSFYIYFVTAWWGVPVTRGDEHSEIKWFDRNELNEIQLASEQYLSIIDAWQKASRSLG